MRPRSEQKRAVTRIVLIDDHELVRYGLKTLLHREPDLSIVGEAETMADGLVMVQRLAAHLVVLNGKRSDASITGACRHLLTAVPKVRILVLSEYAEHTTVIAAIQGGAHGYVLKDMRLEDLTHAIRVVANGQSYLDPRVAQQALYWIRTGSRLGLTSGGIRLTPQERLILPLLAEGKTNKEIGVQLHISDKTVKNYLAGLFDKLHVRRRSEAVAWFMKETQMPLNVMPVSTDRRSQWEVKKVQEFLKDCRSSSAQGW